MTLLALSIQPKAANHSPFEMDWFKPCHSDYSTTYHLYTTCKKTRPICHAWEHTVFMSSLAYLDTHTCTHTSDLCMHFPSCAHCHICLLCTITWHIHVYVWLRHTVEQSLRSCLLSYHTNYQVIGWTWALMMWLWNECHKYSPTLQSTTALTIHTSMLFIEYCYSNTIP